MNFAVLAATFGITFAAELPDKTALASLMLGARYRWWWAFIGVAAAFTVHVVLAVTLGSLLALLPQRVLEGIVAALFLTAAALLLRSGRGDDAEELEAKERATFLGVVGISFVVVLVAEFGDLTQVVIADLAAKYHDAIVVGVGALAGLWSVALLAILGGRSLLRFVPLAWVVRVGAAAMTTLAVLIIVSAVRGT